MLKRICGNGRCVFDGVATIFVSDLYLLLPNPLAVLCCSGQIILKQLLA